MATSLDGYSFLHLVFHTYRRALYQCPDTALKHKLQYKTQHNCPCGSTSYKPIAYVLEVPDISIGSSRPQHWTQEDPLPTVYRALYGKDPPCTAHNRRVAHDLRRGCALPGRTATGGQCSTTWLLRVSESTRPLALFGARFRLCKGHINLAHVWGEVELQEIWKHVCGSMKPNLRQHIPSCPTNGQVYCKDLL